MSIEIITACIGIIGTLLGTILGFTLQFAYSYITKTKDRNSKLDVLLLRIYVEKLVNNYNKELYDLRNFLIENVEILKIDEYKLFFQKWLQDTYVISEDFHNSIGGWPSERSNELMKDIENLPDIKIFNFNKFLELN